MQEKKTWHSGGWTPVTQGDLYCSPACGRGCTRAAFDEATEKAKQLAEQLGPNWKPNVWENLGWHYQAVLAIGSSSSLDGLRVTPPDGPRGVYTACYRQWSEYAQSAKLAVSFMLRQMGRERDEITRQIEHIEKLHTT